MASGRSRRSVARELNLNPKTLDRYAVKYMIPRIEKAKATASIVRDAILSAAASPHPGLIAADVGQQVARASALADPLLMRIDKHLKTNDIAIDGSLGEKDWKGYAQVMRADIGVMELSARLQGKLDRPGNTVNVNAILVMPYQPGSGAGQPAPIAAGDAEAEWTDEIPPDDGTPGSGVP